MNIYDIYTGLKNKHKNVKLIYKPKSQEIVMTNNNKPQLYTTLPTSALNKSTQSRPVQSGFGLVWKGYN